MKLDVRQDQLLTRFVRATLDGQDVTQRCVMADDVRGEVVLIAFGDDGQPVVKDNAVVLETLRGQVRIELRDNAPEPVKLVMAKVRRDDFEIAQWVVAHSWYEGLGLELGGVDLGDCMTYDVLRVLGHLTRQAEAQGAAELTPLGTEVAEVVNG